MKTNDCRVYHLLWSIKISRRQQQQRKKKNHINLSVHIEWLVLNYIFFSPLKDAIMTFSFGFYCFNFEWANISTYVSQQPSLSIIKKRRRKKRNVESVLFALTVNVKKFILIFFHLRQFIIKKKSFYDNFSGA